MRKYGRKPIQMLDHQNRELTRRCFKHMTTAVKNMILDSLKNNQPRRLYDQSTGTDVCTFSPPGYDSQKGIMTIHAPRIFARRLAED